MVEVLVLVVDVVEVEVGAPVLVVVVGSAVLVVEPVKFYRKFII